MSLLDIFFPKKCVGCRKFGEYLCPNCFATLSFIVNPKCLVCNKPSFDGLTHPKCRGKYTVDGYFAALNYKGVLKKLVYQFKYAPYLTDLQTVLGDLLFEQIIQEELFNKVLQKNPILVPIPLSHAKLRKRGYNHAEILAKNLGKRFGLSVENVLQRVKQTKPQYGLKREERTRNIKGAFEIVQSSLLKVESKKRPIFLVDDIVTTGSTLLEAANVLKRNGFKSVYGVILAQD